MKKALLFLISISFANGEVIYKEREYKFNQSIENELRKFNEKETSKRNDIKFNGTIINIKEYRDHYQYTIKDNEKGLIYLRLDNKMYKQKNIISGYCNNKSYSEYIECSVYNYKIIK